MKDEIIKHLNELGSTLEESYGNKLILLDEKDFNGFAETLVKKLTLPVVRLTLPDEEEFNSLKSQYRASGGDAGWIKDAYKKGYIDGWNMVRTDKHLRKSVKKHKPKGN